MTEAKLAPNLPQWMKDHVARYQSSGGTDGHMYTINLPNLPPKAVPSLLLTTTGRKSGDKYLFPLFYGPTGKSYFVVASKGGAPEHPGWYGFNLDPARAKAMLDRLDAAFAKAGRKRDAAFEIIITPPLAMAADDTKKYADLGVHRLVVNLGSQRPEKVDPRLAEIDKLVKLAA